MLRLFFLGIYLVQVAAEWSTESVCAPSNRVAPHITPCMDISYSGCPEVITCTEIEVWPFVCV